MRRDDSMEALIERHRMAIARIDMVDGLRGEETIAGDLPAYRFPLSPEEGDQRIGADGFLPWCKNHAPLLFRAFLESDMAACQAAQAGKAIEVDRPLGIRELLYPVRAGDEVRGLLWSGKALIEPVSFDQISQSAASFNVSDDKLKRGLRLLPHLTPEERERRHAMMESLRTALEWVLRERLSHRSGSLSASESERIQALGSLSTGVAHHFNNLLSIILGYSSFLLNRTEGDEQRTKALRDISEAAQRGRRLTEEILSFAGSEVEMPTACSIHEVLLHVLSLLETQTAGRIHITRDLGATQDTVRAPRSLLHQIVYNLLTNSIDSLPEGGALCVRTLDNVTDQGGPSIGIEVIDGALPPDAPARRISRRKQSRLRGMADQLAGSVVFSGEGNTAQRAAVSLPLDRDTTTLPPPLPRQKRLAPQRIWVVDDDPIFREMCQRVLEEDGHEVRGLDSGPAMQDAWRDAKQQPHLLIIDFSMPDYNGLELCRWLRDQGACAPVILVSGFSHNQPDIHEALKIRRTYFLQKPFPVPELADVVTVALGETLIGEP